MRSRTSKLAGKVVVITGASTGLGRAAALEFAQRKATVVIASRSADTLDDTARLCRAVGTEVCAVVTDVTHEDDVARLVSRARDLTGAIDVWVNNAGVTACAL